MNRLLKQMLLACVCVFTMTGQAKADLLSDANRAYSAGNFTEASDLFMPLAQQGEASAQFNLGVMYYKGQGVPQDYEKAVMWLNKTIANTDSNEQKLLIKIRNAVARLMTEQQIAKTLESAKKCTANKLKGC